MVPTPGPYSTMVRARFQSTRLSRRSIKKRELGIKEPSILGCWMKFFANNSVSSLREGLDSICVIKSLKSGASNRRVNHTRLISEMQRERNVEACDAINLRREQPLFQQ